jgi:hypothetical protein
LSAPKLATPCEPIAAAILFVISAGKHEPNGHLARADVAVLERPRHDDQAASSDVRHVFDSEEVSRHTSTVEVRT